MSKRYLKVKLVKSLIGRLEKHKQTAYSLGLRRINQIVHVEKNPAILGMIKKVAYMVQVEET